ncbi:hypothetical protein GWK41_09340 [Persephonella atlantica]|uniref:ATP synthase F1 complex delta/epsilon subunit N-terminal domain-containing protein n=1 Tax=Persephonella atlantica TaxID=2699429 RepID=A0ABS1GK10_9AQUI|nr:hypothetical protein [Persephonella atlantica]MBK3333273.1 hypothetical protein [Persephonella atlantica]
MKLLNLRFLTPENEETYRAKLLSLEDRLGSLGIYPGHEEYITVLDRSIGYFVDEEDKKIYFAYDFGILSVEEDTVSIITRAVITGLSLESLKAELEKKVSRIESFEKRLRENIKTLERMILKEIIEAERG